MGEDIGKLIAIAQEDDTYFYDKYEFAYGPMLDARMNDATIMIMKVYHWCVHVKPAYQAWDELIPYYLERNVTELRKLSG